MITLLDLQEYKGVTLLESKPGECRFTVPAHVVVKGLGQTVTLDVTCPIVGKSPLLIRSAVTSEDGITCPEAWLPDNIESTLLGNIEMMRRLQATVDLEKSNREQLDIKQDAKIKFRRALTSAVDEYLSVSEFFTLSEYLTICGEIFSSATNNGTINSNRDSGGTGGSTE